MLSLTESVGISKEEEEAETETEIFIRDSVTDSPIEGEKRYHKPSQAPPSTPPPPHNFEDIVSATGPPGRYQIFQCILLGANIIPVVFVNMNFVFIGLEPSFSCSPVNETSLQFHQRFPVNTTTTNNNVTNTTLASSTYEIKISYEECQILMTSETGNTNHISEFSHLRVVGEPKSDVNSRTSSCYNGYSYNGGKHVSIITEWDLVCDERGTAEMTQACMSLGWFIGVFFASTFSDKFGRKKTIAISAALSSICELGCSFAPNIFVMIALRFFSGLFGSGLSAVTFVLGEEMLVSKHRGTFGVYLGLLWSSCAMLLCGIAYIFRESNWRDLQLCLAICGAAPLLFIYFVDESPSWLYSRGKHREATKIIRKICRTNRVEYNQIKEIWEELLCAQETKQDVGDEKAAKDYNVLDLFRNEKLRASVLIAWVAFFTNDFSYFGMYLSAPTLAGNLYLNTTIMAVSEFPGCFWVLAMLRYKGRRFVIIFFMIMAALCVLTSTCLWSAAEVTDVAATASASTAFFLLGKLAISNSHTTTYLYIPELFPTSLRASGMGICLTGGCLGGMIAPYLLPLHHWLPTYWLPGACLIGVMTLCVLLILKLPETKGKQLSSIIQRDPQSIEL